MKSGAEKRSRKQDRKTVPTLSDEIVYSLRNHRVDASAVQKVRPLFGNEIGTEKRSEFGGQGSCAAENRYRISVLFSGPFFGARFAQIRRPRCISAQRPSAHERVPRCGRVRAQRSSRRSDNPVRQIYSRLQIRAETNGREVYRASPCEGALSGRCRLRQFTSDGEATLRASTTRNMLRTLLSHTWTTQRKGGWTRGRLTVAAMEHARRRAGCIRPTLVRRGQARRLPHREQTAVGRGWIHVEAGCSNARKAQPHCWAFPTIRNSQTVT